MSPGRLEHGLFLTRLKLCQVVRILAQLLPEISECAIRFWQETSMIEDGKCTVDFSKTDQSAPHSSAEADFMI